MAFNHKLLKALTDANAIAGHEEIVGNIISEELNSFNQTHDNLGTLISQTNTNTGLKVMLASHMDEVGFIVKDIDQAGFIKFSSIGGWWAQVILGQQVVITTSNNDKIFGIIGSKPPHILSKVERNKAIELDDLYIDIGATSFKQVIENHIKIGDMITPTNDYQVLLDNNLISAKALDNRIGCYIMCEVMKQISNDSLQVFGCATVQEEIGLRGAKTSAYKINPDLAIVIDTGIAFDTPKLEASMGNNKLGFGPLISVLDGGTIGHVGFRKHIQKVAEEHNIKYQLDFLKGGATDAGQIHLTHDGVPTITISIATRYLHTYNSIIHQQDVLDAIKLITLIINQLNETKYLEILNG